MTEHVQTLLDAVALGSIYGLMAIGIGLVFGVLRLVNFAYGQLVMAGAYALALTQDVSVVLSIALCFAVVLALSLAMELAAFRPLRNASPTTMLVATFAISYLLQSIALVRFGAIGKILVVIPQLTKPLTIGSLHVRWITIVTILVAAGVFAALTLFLTRTSIGLQMRAASIDSETARLLGVRANAVITVAVLISGAIAALVAVILPMAVPERILVTPDYALSETIIVLVGVVVGGIDRLLTATLGGFTMGFLVGALSGFLPSSGSWPFTSSVYLDSAVFMLVIVVLLLRPEGLFTRSRRSVVDRV
ncbi:MAG: branched-chain amino acid ABC transporter permease [Actinobacteria bacterium]|nr:MAG: branched-chain amino acid ABC transporter permease [Actinomycetota bacterium]